MAQITFTGDPLAPGTDPASIELDGVSFPFGVAVDVSDEALAAKLARHSHFRVDFAEVEPVDGVETVASLLARADSLKFMAFKSAAAKILGGPAPATKDEIVAALLAKTGA